MSMSCSVHFNLNFLRKKLINYKTFHLLINTDPSFAICKEYGVVKVTVQIVLLWLRTESSYLISDFIGMVVCVGKELQ